MVEIWTLVAISIPTMIFLGMRHALDVDHITAIDSLVRLHNAVKKSRWVGTGFSIGHMFSVLAEMIFIIYIIGGITSTNNLAVFGGVIGAIALGAIGAINIYSMKKWGKSGAAILASKILNRTGVLGPTGSALVTGAVFGLGFDTATQISAIALSAVASATTGIQTALILSGFFAASMILVDTVDGVILRSAFSKILYAKGFRYMSYALSAMALTIASITAFEVLTNSEIIPTLTGPVLAVSIVSASFGYAFATRKKVPVTSSTS
jgi:nickel/cobalt transporter (NiCoT) family protein